MATIRVQVPEAYALDDQGNQLNKMVIKHARTRRTWNHSYRLSLPNGTGKSISDLLMVVWASCDSTRYVVKWLRKLAHA